VFRAPPTAPSNWRSVDPLGEWLAKRNIIGLSGIDTRALTRRIRELGMPKSAIAHDPQGRLDGKAMVAAARKWKGVENADLASNVTTGQRFDWTNGLWTLGAGFQKPASAKHRVVLMDFGVKKNILRNLVAAGCRVTVVPATTPAGEALALKPEGIFLSNGPGDPEPVTYGIEAAKRFVDTLPVFGICLGHQILGLALGGSTTKLKFGHHGGNQPGMDLATGRVAICAENHGYAVVAESLRAAGEPVEITHINLNDQTVEGLAHATRPLFSVQYHPEAAPGPQDARYFFGRFREMVDRCVAGEKVSGAAICGLAPKANPADRSAE